MASSIPSLNVADKTASTSSSGSGGSSSSWQEEADIEVNDLLLDQMAKGKEGLVGVTKVTTTAAKTKTPATTASTTKTKAAMKAAAKLDISLELGGIDVDETDDSEPVLMGINHLMVELLNQPINEIKDEYVKLPGADNKNALKSKYSTGHLPLNVLKEGSYVTLDGMKYVSTNKGCYEIHWMKNKPAGQLVVGFDIPKTYQRNPYYQSKVGSAGACLPQGIIYVSFPIWTKCGLLYAQNEKCKLENELQQLQDDYEDAMYHVQECIDTNNHLMKFVHLHTAHVAHEKYCYHVDNTPLLDCIPNPQDNESMIEIPSKNFKRDGEDEDEDDDGGDDDESFLLSSRGMIYHQERSGGKQHRLIGFATAKSSSSPEAAVTPSEIIHSDKERRRLMP